MNWLATTRIDALSRHMDPLNPLPWFSNRAENEEFWHGIAAAIIIAVAIKLLERLFDLAQHIRHRHHQFSIEGHWIGKCWLPSYQTEEYLEIWRYTSRRDHVRIEFYAYHPTSSAIDKWIGGGVFRGSKLSAYYYQIDRHTYESGVIAMGLSGLQLKGVYAQFDPKAGNEPFHASTTEYSQHRIELPFGARVRMAFGRPPVQSYQTVKSMFDALPSHRAVPSPHS